MRKIKLILLFLIPYALVASASVTFVSVPSKEDKIRIDFLVKSGFKWLNKPNYSIEKAGACIDSAVSFCEKKNIDPFPSLHLLRAEYYFETGDYSNSEEEGKLSIEKAGNSDENEVYVKAALFLGKYYHRTGFYKESMNYYEKCITFSKSRGLKGFSAKAYEGMAYLMNSVGDLKGFRENLRMMVDAGFAENDSLSVEIGLLRLGTSYSDKDRDFRKADSILKKCLEISLIRKDTYYISFSSANIGWNFYTINKFDSSLFYYEKSLKYSIPGKEMGVSGNSLGNIGTIYRDLGDYDKALIYYNKSISFAKQVGDWYGLSWVYNDMSQLYLKKNDTAKAFNSFVLFKKFNDSLLIKNSAQGLTDARIRYEADSHNKEVALAFAQAEE